MSLDVVLVSPPLEYSAATLYTLNLAPALAARGTRALVVSPGGRFEPAFTERGIAVRKEPLLGRAVMDWLLLRRLTRDLAGEGARIVHGQSAMTAALASDLGRRLGVPTVLTVQRFYDPLTSPEIDWRGIRAVIALGENLRADVVNRRRAPREIVHAIQAGIAPGPEPRPPFSRPDAPPVIGTLGEVERAETQAQFVRTAKQILARAPDAQFLVVGEGAEPRALRSLVRELQLSASFTFTNVIDHRKVLPEMDVCIMPSIKEGAGHAILEAMAAARPVIATGAGGAYEVIQDEETGLLVEKDDPAFLAAAVLRLLFDRPLAQRFGRRAREVVLERFRVERMVEDTLGVYKNVMS